MGCSEYEVEVLSVLDGVSQGSSSPVDGDTGEEGTDDALAVTVEAVLDLPVITGELVTLVLAEALEL